MAGTTGQYNIIIRATDATSTIVAKINKSLVDQNKFFGGLNKSVSSLGKEFARFGRITGITAISKDVVKLGKYILNAAAATFKLLLGLVGLSGIASVVGIVGLTNEFSKYNQSIWKSSLRLNENAQELERWQHMAELGNVSAEAMTQTMEGLEATMRNALTGNDDEAMRTFAQFGISGKKATELLPQIADVIKGMHDTGASAATINALLGKWHVPLEMLPLLLQGSAGMKELAARTKEYNTLSEKGMKLAKLYFEAQTLLDQSVHKLKNSVGEALTPAMVKLYDSLRPVIDSISTWLNLPETSKWISETTIGLVERFATWLQSLTQQDFSKFFADLKDLLTLLGHIATDILAVVKGFNEFIESTVGWKLAIEAFGLILVAKLLNPLTSIVAKLGVLFGLRLPTWLLGLLGLSGATGAALASTLAIGGDTAEQNPDRENAWNAGPEAWEKYKKDNPSWTNWLYETGAGTPGGKKPKTGEMDFTPAQWDAYRESILKMEHARTNQMGGAGQRYAGQYQMGPDEIRESANRIGITPPSQQTFLDNPAMQDLLFASYTQAHFEQLMRNPKFAALSKDKQAEILAYAHNQGARGASDYLNSGVVGKDGFGTPGTAYSDTVRKAWPSGIKAETLAPLQQQSLNQTANVNVAFNGFPPGLFKTSASASGMGINTSRTSGPIFA